MTRAKVLTFAVAAVAGAALAIPSLAAAETFCVGAPAGCIGTPVSSGGLRQALLAAQSNGTADSFVLAPGEYTATGFAHDSSEPVEIVGAGEDRTTLRTLSSPDGVAITGSRQSSISGVRVVRTQDVAASALTLGDAQARDVIVEATGAPVEQAVSLTGGAALDRIRIVAGGAARGVLTTGGDTAVRDTSMQATFGIVARGGGATTVERVAIRASAVALAVQNARMTARDTLADMTGPSLVPLEAVSVDATGANAAATVDGRHLTFAGSQAEQPNQAAAVLASASGAGAGVDVALRDTAIGGFRTALFRRALSGASADVAVDRSATPAAIGTDQGPGAIRQTDRIAAAPAFVSAETGDFHLVPGSALVDAGTPGGRPPEATDLDGRPRTSDGDGDCTAVPDVGAYEVQRPACPTAPGSSTPAGEAPGSPPESAARRVTKLRVSPAFLRLGTALPRLVSKPARRPAATIRFTASHAGTVTLRFARVGKRGRLKAIRTAIRVKAKPGVNRISFTGRLSRRVRLAPGRHRVTARLSGQRTAPASARLTILLRRR